jgi:hypothetical protein
LERQRFALGKLPVLIDRIEKSMERILPVTDGFPNAVFN